MVQLDPEDLVCEYCNHPLPSEDMADFERNLARHILDEHQDVASDSALRYSREKIAEHNP